MDTLLERWIVDESVGRRDPELKPLSGRAIRVYAASIRAYLQWLASAGIEWDQADPDTIALFVKHLIDTPPVGRRSPHRSPNTVVRVLNQVRRFYRWAEFRELVTSDPTATIRGPRQLKVRMEPLSPMEIATVLANCYRGRSPFHRWRALAFYTLIYSCGFRVGEIVQTEDSPGLALAQLLSGSTPDGFVDQIKIDRKGGKQATLPLLPVPRAALRHWMEVRRGACDALFTNIDGEPFTYAAAKSEKARMEREIGFHFTFQELRRTFGTEVREDGLPLLEIQTLYSHSKPEVTDLYTWAAGVRGAHRKLREHDPFERMKRDGRIRVGKDGVIELSGDIAKAG